MVAGARDWEGRLTDLELVDPSEESVVLSRGGPHETFLDSVLNIVRAAKQQGTTTNMAKKRKAGGRAYGDSKAPKKDESKLNVNSWEDVADSEDEFLLNREKVLLDEGPAAKRMRKYQEEGASYKVCSCACTD